jgi:hypothetical protein
MRPSPIALVAASVALAALAAPPALAGSHQWRFSEIFSNLDNSVVFIEMVECCGNNNEVNLFNKPVTAVSGSTYVFPANLPCSNCTANEHLLLATQSFADLPGAPTPDYILPANFVLPTGGDTLTWHVYGAATWIYGAMPVDGVRSLDRDGTTGINSPTNLAGTGGTVTAPCRRSDIDISGQVDVGDLLDVLGDWGACPGCAADLNDDNVIDVTDLLQVLAEWGTC